MDGELKATVPSTSADNPLSDFGKDTAFPGDFQLIQYWQNGQSATITLPQGDPGPSGSDFTKVEIFNAHPAGVATGETIGERQTSLRRPPRRASTRIPRRPPSAPSRTGCSTRVHG